MAKFYEKVMTGKKIVVRSTDQRGGLNPEAVEVLSSSIRSPLYHTNYRLRHPFGIYNVSINRIFDSVEKFMNSLLSSLENDFDSKNLDPDWDLELRKNLEVLLHALMEHMDDCESILQCFYPRGTKLSRENVFTSYQSDVASYRKHIGKVVNQLKHHQGRIRFMGMFYGDVPHLGYFIEGLDDKGSLGPDPNIHTKAGTAFTFSRDVRYHIHSIYHVALKLSEAITSIANLDESESSYEIADNNTKIERILKSAIDLPMIVFVDELQKEFPHLMLETFSNGHTKFSASMKKYPHGLRTPPSPVRYMAFYKSDGVSRKFRIPYSRL